MFSFLGSVSTVAGKVVRPHDLRVELREPGSEETFVAEITRGAAAALRLNVGDEIYVPLLKIADVEVADRRRGGAEGTGRWRRASVTPGAGAALAPVTFRRAP